MLNLITRVNVRQYFRRPKGGKHKTQKVIRHTRRYPRR